MSNLNNIQSLNTDIIALFSHLLENKQDKKSCIFDVSSVLQVLKLAYHGTGNKNRQLLTHLKNMLEIAPEPMESKSAVLIRNDFNFTQSYFDEYSNDVYLGHIPINDDDVSIINENISDPTFINNVMDANAYLAIINKSSFNGNWEITFDDKVMDDFQVGNNQKKQIPMMFKKSADMGIDTLECHGMDSLVVSLNYNNGYKMLIIRPNKPQTKEQLITLYKNKLNGKIIQDIIDNMKEEDYNIITMPKFTLKSKWNLKDAASNVSYLKQLFHEKDYSNISPEIINGQLTSMKSESEINNTELGTSVTSRSDLLVYDYHPQKEMKLELNRPFIFMIMDNESRIFNIGLFVG